MLSEPERRAPARLDTLDRDPAQAELELSAPPKSGTSVFTENTSLSKSGIRRPAMRSTLRIRYLSFGFDARSILNLIIPWSVVVALGYRTGGIDSGRVVPVTVIENTHSSLRLCAGLLE